MIRGQADPDRIVSRPDQFGGEPFIATVRVPVAEVLQWLGKGGDRRDLLARYPGLEQDDLAACVEFARVKVEAANGKLIPDASAGAQEADWKELQSRHGVSDEFLDAACQVFERHDEILRRLA